MIRSIASSILNGVLHGPFLSTLQNQRVCWFTDNRVCEQDSRSNTIIGEEIVFPPVEPGAEFVTRWGVVRVVSDSRVVPTAKLSTDAAANFKHWKTRRTRQEAKRRENYKFVTINSLARRKRLGEMYEESHKYCAKPQRLQKDTWYAYFGSRDPREPSDKVNYPDRAFPKVVPALPNGPHPMEPEGCHPDRIVECILIPDKRPLYICRAVEVDDGTREFVQEEREGTVDESTTDAINRKLYIQRRELNNYFSAGGLRFCCENCGNIYLSVVGARHHVLHSCKKDKGDQARALRDSLEKMDHRAEQLIKRQDTPLLPARTSSYSAGAIEIMPELLGQSPEGLAAQEALKIESSPQERPTKRKWPAKKKRELAYYPQVWRALGFKVLPRIKHGGRVSFFGKKGKKGPTVHDDFLRAENIPEASILDTTIKTMKEELHSLRDKELGAYYPQVWKSLRFRKPSKEPFSLLPEAPPTPPPDEPSSEEEFIPKPQWTYAKAPVIIDVSVLAGEIEAGRYPSIKHNNEKAVVEHDDQCAICKDPRGDLYCCDFCSNVNHLPCIRTRFIIKDPEPHDDFMCHKCIQYILQRRRRAEKRRLKSNNRAGISISQEEGYETLGVQQVAVLPPLAATNGTTEDDATILPGQELDALAKESREVENILELLKDSQSRLRQLVETVKINDFRRRQFEDL